MKISKRKKFFIVSVFLSWGLALALYAPYSYRYWALLALGILAYPLSAWSLHEDLDGVEWIFNLILPTLFLPSLALFYFLLPIGSLWRVFVFILVVLGQYAVLLSANIFSVAIIRTIQLLRAAQAIGFLFTLLIAFFLLNSLFSFRLSPHINALGVTLISYPLIIQSLWSVKLDKKNIKLIILSSAYISFILMQLSFLISIWPVNILIASLWVLTFLYIMLSLFHYHLDGRLFQKTVAEYTRIVLLIFLITFLMAKWG